jgi:hypothetical protein
VCKTGAPTTGTRLGASRECHTQREWNERAAQAQNNTENAQRQGLQGFSGPVAGAKGK